MSISDSAPISTEQREAILRDFQQKHGIRGTLSVKRNKQAETGKNKVYDLIVKSGGATEYKAQLFVKQGKEIFTAKLLVDSLAAHEQTELFQNFLSNMPQSLFDLNVQEAQPEQRAAQEEIFSEDTLAKSVITQQSENFNVQLWQKPDSSSEFVYSGNGRFCNTIEEAREFAAKRLEEYNAAHRVQPESTIHFGNLGNGITCYDIAHTDSQTGDHQTVAHISENGKLTWYNIDYDLSDEDDNRITEMADRQRDRFIARWVGQSIESRFSTILASAKLYQMSQIADDTLTMEEKVRKYEKSIIFGDEEFPLSEPKFEVYQMKSGEEYHYQRGQSLEENRNENLRITDYDLVYTANWRKVQGYTSEDKLNNVFAMLNADQRPKGFNGHSLSVSDVVLVTENGEQTAYYVDRIGFAEYTDFLKPKNAPHPIDIQGYDLTVDFAQTPFLRMEYQTEEYLGGIDENGHERKDNFSAEDRILTVSSQNDGSVTISTPDGYERNLNPYNDAERESIAEEIKDYLDSADFETLRVSGGSSLNQLSPLPQLEKTVITEDQPEWSYYIIADLSTWSVQSSGTRSPLERFNTADEAIARFRELRNEPYNSEAIYVQNSNTPAARLTLGVSHSSRTAEFDLLHVRGGQNYLCTDYLRNETAMQDAAFKDTLPRIAQELGIERVIAYDRNADGTYSEGKDLSFAEWTAQRRTERQEEAIRNRFMEMDLPHIMAKSALSWDEIEDLSYRFLEKGYIDRRKPNNNAIYGNGLHEPDLDALIRRQQNGENITRELVVGLLGNSTEMTFDTGMYDEMQAHRTETGYTLAYHGTVREVTFEQIENAFMKLFRDEYAEIQEAIAKEEAENSIKIEPAETGILREGDRYRYQGREYEVTNLDGGIYPDDVVVMYTDPSGKYQLQQNIDRFLLMRDGEFLGNSHDAAKQTTQSEAVPEDFTEREKMLAVKARVGDLRKMLAANYEQGKEQLRKFATDYVDNLVTEQFSDDDAFIMHYFGDGHDRIVDDVFEQAYQSVDNEINNIYQIVKYSEDFGDDDGQSFRTLDEAVQEGQAHLAFNEYDGFTVLNTREHKIEYTEGNFPSTGIFSEQVYKNSGMLPESQEADTTEQISEMVKEVNRRTVEQIETGDYVTLPEGIFVVDQIDGDFSISMTNTDAESLASQKSYFGKWKEQMQQEAGDTPIVVTKADVVRELQQRQAVIPADRQMQTVRNLNQLKKKMEVGMQFEITAHNRPECVGERRIVSSVNSVGFTSQKLDIDGNPDGRDIHMEWGKAPNWKISGGTFTSSLDNVELLMQFHFISGNEQKQAQEQTVTPKETVQPETLTASTESETAPVMQQKRGRTQSERLYKMFCEMYPDIASGEHEYERYNSPENDDENDENISGYEPLSVEHLGGDMYSWATTYVQNGDLMDDPDIAFRLDHENQRLEILEFQMDGVPNVGTYYVRCEDETGNVDALLRKELERTMMQNLENARLSDRVLIRYTKSDGETVIVPHDKEEEPTVIPVQPAADDKSPELRAMLNAFAEEHGLGNLSVDMHRYNYQLNETFADGYTMKLGDFYADNNTPDEIRKGLDNWTKQLERQGIKIENASKRLTYERIHRKADLPPVPDLPEIVYAENPQQKARENITAIRELLRLRRCEEYERPLYEKSRSNEYSKETSDMKLRRYSGWGGLQDVFNESKAGFAADRDELKRILTEREYAAIKSTVTDAHYTSQFIVDAMYKAVMSMGLQRDSRILEPACGTGNFISRMPHGIGESGVVGVEIDPITAEIAKRLNNQNPDVTIMNCPFERSGLANNSFDLVIGNVPFGEQKLFDPDYTDDWLIHDAFFRKALDKVAAGGVVAFITSSGTMDKKNSKIREYIAERADLIGAVRLPNTAFAEAGTGVTADIVFLKKRETPLLKHEKKPDWVHLATDQNGLLINSYFVENPQMVLGTMRKTSYYDRLTCDPITETPLEKQLDAAISNLRAQITVKQRAESAAKRAGQVQAWGNDQTFQVKDGKIYFRDGDSMEEVTKRGNPLTDKNREIILTLIELRKVTRELLNKQKTNCTDEDLMPLRKQLNEIYDTFYQKHGERMGDVSGVTTAPSARAQDMQMKCDYFNEQLGQGHILFCTGTPVSNSMTEMYVMTRYLRPDLLRAAGVERFDDWAATFGKVIAAYKQSASGELKLKTSFSKFANLPELMAMYKEFADIQSAEKLQLPRPSLIGGKPEIVKVQASPEQREYVTDLARRAERITNGAVDPHIDNLLKITGEARLIGLGNKAVAALYRQKDDGHGELPSNFQEDENGKVDECVNRVLQYYHDTDEQKGVQIIFSDIAVNSEHGNFSVYDYIRDELIAKGIPKDEIIFAPKADSKERAEIFRAINEGQYRVVIGSTGTIGTGANIQKKLYACHHIDIPWKPSDFSQREGRILRQGNQFEAVRILNYVTEGTLDSYLYQVVTDKARFIAQLLDDKCPARVSEDCDEKVLTYAELQAAAEGRPEFRERIEVGNRIAELNALKEEHNHEMGEMRIKISSLPQTIESKKTAIVQMEADKKSVDALRDSATGKIKEFALQRPMGTLRKHEDINAYLLTQIQNRLAKPFDEMPSYKIGDFTVSVQIKAGTFDEPVLAVKGKRDTSYYVSLNKNEHSDNWQRIVNFLESGIDKEIEQTKKDIEKCEGDLQQARDHVDEPFALEGELQEAQKKYAELEAKLSGLSEQKEEVFDPDNMADEESAEERAQRKAFEQRDDDDLEPDEPPMTNTSHRKM